jgi:hypothetical protein
MAHVGAVAEARGAEAIVVPCAVTAKNTPARRFFEQVAGEATESAFRLGVHAAKKAEDGASASGGDGASASGSEGTRAGGSGNGLGAGPVPASHFWSEVARDRDVGIIEAACRAVLRGRGEQAQGYVPPRSDAERVIAEVFATVLGVDRVGVFDNYFALGGDSIQSIQIAFRARAAGLLVAPHDVAMLQTVAALAEAAQPASAPASVVPSPEAEEAPFALSGMQQFMLAHYARENRTGGQPPSGAYHFQHWISIEERSDVSPQALVRALDRLARRHPMLRARVRNGQQVVLRDATLPLCTIDLTGVARPEQERMIADLMREDRARTFDALGGEAPLRVYFVVRSKRSFELGFSAHHAFGDGWGYQEVLNELVETYQTDKRGETVTEPADPADTYRRFVALERDAIASDAMRAFWTSHLGGGRRASTLDPPARPAVTSPELAQPVHPLVRRMSEGEVTRLREAARTLEVSPKAICVSALLDAIQPLLGGDGGALQNRATIGVVTNGRSERLPDALKAFGLFWSLAPLCHAIETDKRVQARGVQLALGAVERHAAYPLVKILEDVAPHAGSLFFATLNFVSFHNARWSRGDGGLEVVRTRSFDRFHFPLNLKFALEPTGFAEIALHYDVRWFDAGEADAILTRYLDAIHALTR